MILKAIAALIFFQQVLVINIGGSLKSYEVITGLLFCISIVAGKFKFASLSSGIAFAFLVVIPTISLLLYYGSADTSLYYIRFPEAQESVRYDTTIAPLMLLIYYFLAWILFNELVSSKSVYNNMESLIRIFILSGSGVALYSLYALFGIFMLGLPDPIPDAIDFRNFQPEVTFRSSGFSNEASVYVLMESWILVYLIFAPELFKSTARLVLIGLHLIVLLFTFSSMLLVFVGVMGLVLMVQTLISHRIRQVHLVLICLGIAGVSAILANIGEQTYRDLYYILVTKVSNFFVASNHTLDSGSFRAYTTKLGLMTFADHPFFGVGGGLSPFFLFLHEFDAGVLYFGQKLHYSIPPQNAHAKILAELGLFGYGSFIALYGYLVVKLYRFRSQPLCKASLVGMFMMFSMLMSIFPIYSLFIWLPLGFAANLVFWHTRGGHRKDANATW